jgi:hypothetical protein
VAGWTRNRAVIPLRRDAEEKDRARNKQMAQVADHYREVVKPPEAPRSDAFAPILRLLTAGIAADDLCRAADRYAAECERKGLAPPSRLTPAVFYTDRHYPIYLSKTMDLDSAGPSPATPPADAT